MKESPLILYIVHFIVCVTVMVMVSLEIRKYGTQDMLLCALKWFSLTAVIDSGFFLDEKIKKVKEESRKEKVDQYIKIFSMEKVFEQFNPLGGDKKNDV